MVAPTGSMAASALTASAARTSQLQQAVNQQRIPQWQLDSFAYYDTIGVVRYAAQFWARGLSKIRFFAAEKDDSGEVKETNDRDAVEAFERLQDPMGGRVGLTTAYGHLRFLVGESYLVWTPAKNSDPEQWEIISTLELRKLSRRGGKETWHRIEAPGLNPMELVEAEDSAFEPMPNEVIVYRLWQRHPAYSKMADSPMRSVLADCEEIVRCTHTINARLISRLAGPGIFAIPMSWKVKPLTQVADEEEPESDPFQARLTRAMIAAIGTPGSAESVAPIVVRVPDETTAEAKLYKIWDPNETIRELETREKAVHRYAQGVDMPPAKVEGIEGTTHWNAWAIDKEGMEHLSPVAQAFCDDVGSAYLRPTLRETYQKTDWDRFVVGYDAAAAVTNPDEFSDALKLYEARAVGKSYLRAAGNATDKDAMTDEELQEAIFVATRSKVDVESGAIVVEAPAPVSEGGEPPSGEDTEQDMPEEPDADDVAAQANGNGQLSAEAYIVLGAAELALEQIRARIGMKLRSHFAGGKCSDCIERVREQPAPLIAHTLGAELIAEQGVNLGLFAEDAGNDFGALLERRGVSMRQARALQEVLERHAVATIYDLPVQLPTGFVGRVLALEAAA